MTIQTRQLEPIPHPPTRCIIGNALALRGADTLVEAFMKLASELGPIYQLQFPSVRLVNVGGHDLIAEVCDDQRFEKAVHGVLREVREFGGDGLFTADNDEPNWSTAHSVLMPPFSMAAMREYHPAMLEIANQLMARWESAAAHDVAVEVADDMTRLTLDTIGLCAFDFRFESFNRKTPHPFIDAMVGALSEAQARSARIPFVHAMMIHQHRAFRQQVQKMNEIVDAIIEERRRSGAHKKDLLSAMMTGADKAGRHLDDVNIRYQCITFLIAGHETTSGLLSFALYFLLQNAEVLQKAYEEVDRVLGRDEPSFESVRELHYLQQILKESLRHWPTAPGFFRKPRHGDEVLGGRWLIPQNQPVTILTPVLHRDPRLWGPYAERFDPDHFSPQAEAQRPPHAWLPFGTGPRACIGRQFAMQEAALVLGMLLQRFELVDAFRYQLKIKETLTIKPDAFRMKVRRRVGKERAAVAATPIDTAKPAAVGAQGTGLLVLYGSNMGSSEACARRIASDGETQGFAVTLAPLDEYAGRLPQEGATVIVCSSYNGSPPDNAARFCAWLDDADPMPAVRYAVFGCGHHDWAATYQKVPRHIDDRLAVRGAQRLLERGEGDAAGDFEGQFDRWYQKLWPTIGKAFGLNGALPEAVPEESLHDLEMIEDRLENPFVELFGARPMVVVSNSELHRGGGRSVRHIEIALPEGVTYQAGDHLGIIPQNSDAVVKRAASRFHLTAETRVRLTRRSGGKTILPLDRVVSVGALLTQYVELQDVATRRQLRACADHAPGGDRARLLAWCEDEAYNQEILAKRKSLLDVLEELPACDLPFVRFLEACPPLRPRYYSISSSPQVLERICSITVGVVDAPAQSGHGQYRGVCSSGLSQKARGSSVYAFLHDTHSTFRPPRSAATPMIMIGPGTGVAPFRGFLQERAARRKAGDSVGPTMLFFGCRDPQHDFIYQEELEQMAKDGVVELSTAFSRVAGSPRVWVQDRLQEQKARILELLSAGGVVYVCGEGGKMAPAVRKTLAELIDVAALTAQGRYLEDVWAQT